MGSKAWILIGLFFFLGCQQKMATKGRLRPYEGAPGKDIPGTVARGSLRIDEARDEGTLRQKLVTDIPIPIRAPDLKRGQERFQIYCSVCHSPAGDGQGRIVQRGFLPPPSYHIDRLRDAPAGHFFQVITYGTGAMYSYADRVSVEDRWRIIAYIRALQLSQNFSVADLTPEELKDLGKDQK